MIDFEKINKNKSINELLQFSIINIDKPTGPTSFSVSSFVREKLKANKTSHFGTLDPMVTGVLPVGINRACRLNEFLMHRDKEYIGIMRLHADIDEGKLEDQVMKFIGKIKQLPPIRSRVKREERVREVKEFHILEIDGKDVLFRSVVQAGTYIRKLIHDMGLEIGGAHMLELRRTKAGFFDEYKIYNLYQFEKALEDLQNGKEETLREMLVTGEEALSKVMPIVMIKENSTKQILTGKPLMRKDVLGKLPDNQFFAVYSEDRLLSVMRKVDEGSIIARSEFVLN